MTALERLYPNRCFDCLAAIPFDDVLCAKCQALYAAERQRRKDAAPSPSAGSTP